MYTRLLVSVSTLLAAFWLAPAMAAAPAGIAAPDRVTSNMEKVFPGIKVSDIQSSPVTGVVEVEVNGSDRAYVTSDGKYMFVGDLYRIDGDKPVNLTEQRLTGVRAKALAQLKASDMITFKAKGAQKAQVYVFTDITCPYCEKFHQGVKQINALGITVHYLAFPRAGLGSQVAKDMSRVWCAKDQQHAMTIAKLRQPVDDLPERDNCQSPVADQYDLGVALGVRGTPSIMTVDGKELGGYLSPAQLAGKLGLKKAG